MNTTRHIQYMNTTRPAEIESRCDGDYNYYLYEVTKKTVKKRCRLRQKESNIPLKQSMRN